MKIVVSSTGATLKAEVDPRFGRAAFLLIYDTDKKEVVEVIDNVEGQDATQGAGISVAALMAQKGVEAILTGRVGPKAMEVVDKAGIKVVSSVIGTVGEAINEFLGHCKDMAPGNVTMAKGTVPRPGCRSQNRGQGPGRGSGMGRGQGGRGRGRIPER